MILALALLAVMPAPVPDPEPLLRAHAHNDYEHTRPLLDALDQGFCSIEADIYLVDGELRVGHDRKDLVPGRTLEKLYLDPLYARVKAHHGHVYEKPAPVTLLVDIKTDGEAVYAALRERLPKYKSMLTEYREGRSPVRQRAITIILSGDRPVETLRKEKSRLAFIDGRLSDMKEGAMLDPTLIPLVSDNYALILGWNGKGEMPEMQKTRLADISRRTHAAGVRLRFWAAPDNPAVWKALYDGGVDLLNADDLPGLAAFLHSQPR